MSHQPDMAVLWMATICADLIVLGGWLACASVVIVGVNRRVRRLVATLPPNAPDELGDTRLLGYGASCFAWPIALAFGIYWLQKPATARAGRVCTFIALGHFTAAVLAAIAIVFVLVSMFPSALAPPG